MKMRLQSSLDVISLLLIVFVAHNGFAADIEDRCRSYNIRDQVPISSLDFSRDGKRLVVSAETVTAPDMRVIDLLVPEADPAGTKMTEFGKHHMGTCVRFAPDGRFVASGAWAATIDIWDVVDVATPQLVHSFPTEFVDVTALAFSPNEALLIAGGMKDAKTKPENDELILFDFKKRQRLASIPIANDPTHLIFSPDGRRVYSADTLNSIFVIDVEKRLIVNKWRALDDDANDVGVLGLSLSGDGRRLASGGRDNKVKIWEAETGKLLKSFGGYEDDVLSVVLSPDGKYVAAGSFDGILTVHEVQTGRIVKSASYGTNRANSLAFSPDSQWLASGSADGRIFLDPVADFQLLTPKPKAELKPVPSTK